MPVSPRLGSGFAGRFTRGCRGLGGIGPRPTGGAPRAEGRRVSGLPGGAVTFLFSDIEGSTRLVKALRERYPQVLAEHRRLVRAAIAGQAGHEVDIQGDAFFAAFASAKQAALCALEIQRALTAHRVASRRAGPGPDRHSHRPRSPGPGSLYRIGRPSRGPDLRGRPRRPGAGLPGDADDHRGRRRGSGLHAARRGRAQAEGSGSARSAVPVGRART